MHRLNKNAYANIIKLAEDMACIALSSYLTVLMCRAYFHIEYNFLYTWIFIVFAPVYILGMHTQGMYQKTTFFYPDRVVKNVIVSCVKAFFFIWVFRPFVVSVARQNRVLGVFMLSVTLVLIVQNYLYVYMMKRIKGSGGRRGIIIGDRNMIMEYFYFINKTSFRINITGYIPVGSLEPIPCAVNLGRLEDLKEILSSHPVDEVIFALPRDHVGSVSRYVEMCEQRGITVKIVLDLFDLTIAKTYVHSVGTLPVLTYHTVCLNEMQLLIKRIMDIIGALIGIALTCLLSLFIIPAIELDSRGPVLFAQNRVGQNGRVFRLFKFRSMCRDAELMKDVIADRNEISGGYMFKIKNDPRVTKVGAFLRRTSLDELPQFFNVLKGEMSLVGTRPPTLDEVGRYNDCQYRRISIKPGITGLWQISGRSAIKDFDEIVRLDTHYIDNWSVLTDIKIILKTLMVVINGKGAC